MHSAKRLVNMPTHARRHHSARARVGMFASRCLFSQLSKNQVLPYLEGRDWFCIIPCDSFAARHPCSHCLRQLALSGDTRLGSYPYGLGASRLGYPRFARRISPRAGIAIIRDVVQAYTFRRRPPHQGGHWQPELRCWPRKRSTCGSSFEDSKPHSHGGISRILRMTALCFSASTANRNSQSVVVLTSVWYPWHFLCKIVL